MAKYLETAKAEKISDDLLAGKPGAAKKAAKALRELVRERDALRRMDNEAANYVESVICLRTDFTGEPPYVGWKGIGMSLNEALDERDRLRRLLSETSRKEGSAAALPRDISRFQRLAPIPAAELTKAPTPSLEFLSTAELAGSAGRQLD